MEQFRGPSLHSAPALSPQQPFLGINAVPFIYFFAVRANWSENFFVSKQQQQQQQQQLPRTLTA
jgi:hypothetical protein